MVHAASVGDRARVLQKSKDLKFLTGYEAKVWDLITSSSHVQTAAEDWIQKFQFSAYELVANNNNNNTVQEIKEYINVWQ